jgi:hypothetical protein
VSLAFKQYLDGRQNGMIIIDDENACHGTRSAIRRPTCGCRLCQFVTEHKLDCLTFWSRTDTRPRKTASLEGASGNAGGSNSQPMIEFRGSTH